MCEIEHALLHVVLELQHRCKHLSRPLHLVYRASDSLAELVNFGGNIVPPPGETPPSAKQRLSRPDDVNDGYREVGQTSMYGRRQMGYGGNSGRVPLQSFEDSLQPAIRPRLSRGWLGLVVRDAAGSGGFGLDERWFES